eukprot:4337232-Karenia_brevis.AAC.1
MSVMEVKRMIGAVSKMVATGHIVVFGSDKDGGSYIYNKKEKVAHKFWERHGVYEIPIWIKMPCHFGGHPCRG